MGRCALRATQRYRGAVVGLLSPGEKLPDRGTKKGLVFAATPASDFICGMLRLAAGMNLHVFTTGRGSPTPGRGASHFGPSIPSLFSGATSA
jgi:altronate dehydratase